MELIKESQQGMAQTKEEMKQLAQEVLETEQKLMQGQLNLVLKLQDMDTAADTSVTIRIYRDSDPMLIWTHVVKALNTAMENMGLLAKEKTDEQKR